MPLAGAGAVGAKMRHEESIRRSTRRKEEANAEGAGDSVLIPLQEMEGGSACPDAAATEIPDMATSGNWTDFSTLEKPRETNYERPAPGCRTKAAKIAGFFLFFGCNGFPIAYLVPLVLKAMLGI